METQVINIKASNGEEKRRFQLVKENGSATFSFVTLLDKLVTLFALQDASQVSITCLDQNNDNIAISNDADLDTLLNNQNLLKIHVTYATQSKSTVSASTKHRPERREKRKATSSSSDEESNEKSQKREQKRLEKEAKRELKRQKKEKKAEERAEKKHERTEEKEKKKMERAEKKLERKAEKEANKELRKQKKKEENSEEKAAKRFSEGVSYLYLDGNNMLFVADALRKLTLGKKRTSAEQLLYLVAQKLHQKLGNLTYSEVMYDSTKLQAGVTNSVTLSDARKNGYSIADDALVDIAKKLGAEEAKKSVFITSDRELKERLADAGATTLGPKGFLNFAFQQLNEDPAIDSMNAWLLKLVEENSL